MKVTHGIGLVVIGVAIGGGAWLGCGGDDSNGGTGGGGQDGSVDGSGGGGDDSGGGGGDSGGGGGDSGGGDTGGGGTVSCATYCDQVMAHCTGAFPTAGDAAPTAQYLTKEGCLAECARMAPGTINDTGGQDTVGCRQYHSGTPATQNPALHCAHGGPSGGGVCSGGAQGTDRCATFCNLQAKICQADSGTGVTLAEQPFASVAECMTACATAPYTFSTTNAELILGDNANGPPDTDNLNCRQYHLMAAYNALDAGSAATHCPHLKVNSATCK